jgi:hypothetical protein
MGRVDPAHMNRSARVALMLAALLAIGAVAVAQASDGSSGSGGGSGSDGGHRTAQTVVTPALGTITTPATTVKNGTATTVSAPGQVKPKSDETDGDDQSGDDGGTPAGDHIDGTATLAAPGDPVLGKQLDVTPEDGDVRVRQGDGQWTDLAAGAGVPNGTVVDARRGAVKLAAAVDADGTQQSATFSGAIFAFQQPSATRPVTVLKLEGGDFSVCKRAPATAGAARAVAAARRKPVRRLFGSGHGRFRTEGRFAAATVHGTIWVTEDFCDRTVVTVKRGVVGVTDLRSGRTVNVRAGSSRTILRRR